MTKQRWTTRQQSFTEVGKARQSCGGQIFLMLALVLPALVAFMALSLDVGFMYHMKRRLQTAADAGALGGAREIWRQNSGLVTSAAKNDTGLNGYRDANATVTVNNPPSSGPRAGDRNFVEVIVSQNVPTYFMKALNRESTTVRARAVAGVVPGFDVCVIALNPTEPAALKVNGSSSLSANCGVMVNSSDPAALVEDGGACLSGTAIGVSGRYTSGGADCFSPMPTTGDPPILDPLAYLTPPPRPATVRSTSILKLNSDATLDPGVYVGGISIQSGANITFNPGLYYIDGGWLAASGNSALTGNGVTFYTTSTSAKLSDWGSYAITGGVIVNLKAPSSGPYAGILLWADPNTPNQPKFWAVLGGTSNSAFDGAIYLPSINVTYSSPDGAAGWTMLIADTITVSGGAAVRGSASTVPPPTRLVTLVE